MSAANVIVLIVGLMIAVVMSLIMSSTSYAAATNVSTGASSACAVIDKKALCWGDGANGKLGNGSSSDVKKPTPVYVKAGTTEKKTCSAMEKVFGCKEKTIMHGASALYGKTVTKVSVGTNHACAIADAAAYCWGKNDKGQLGIGSSGWLQSENVPMAVSNSGNSALAGKEVVDISAGQDFTCALASNGMVACWGDGANGRLGTNNTNDVNTPTPVYGHTTKGIAYVQPKVDIVLAQAKQQTDRPNANSGGSSGSSNASNSAAPRPAPVTGLSNKKGVRLAKASESTMCAIVVEKNSSSLNGNAYCWGKGIDNGTGIPADESRAVTCGKVALEEDNGSRSYSGSEEDVKYDSTTSYPIGKSKTVIFESSKPTLIPGVALSSIDGQDYVTGLGTDGRAHYWGMYGYEEKVSYANVKSCTVNPCTSMTTIKSSNDNLEIVTALSGREAADRAKNNAAAGNRDNRGTPKVVNGHPGMANYQIKKDGNKVDCKSQTFYGFTRNVVHTQVGQRVTTQPPTWPGAAGGFRSLSGNAYNGLFCASSGSSTYCDAHGTSQSSGQTGSGFTQSCGLLGCSPAAPSGPQGAGGWLSGKQVTQLSTSSTGFTCAVASGAIGCWGVNSNGQLGVGDTKARTVPTGVGQ